MLFLIIMLLIGVWWWRRSQRLKRLAVKIQNAEFSNDYQSDQKNNQVFDGEFEEIKRH